jgi:tetratricopeptide (TPR) repeat protein
MGKKIKIKRAVGLMSALILFAGFIYGCYSRGALSEEKNIYGQDVRPDPLSEKEIRKFAESVRMVDGEAEAHYKLALYFQEHYRHKLAIDELKQVLLRSFANAKAYNALGVSFDNLGDHEAAIDYYKIALNIDSKLDYAYNNLGYSYLLKGDLQRAAEAFKQAIALNEKEKRYRNNLGLVYAKQDKYELAYEQFKALDSEANAEKLLAKVMADLGSGSATQQVLLAIKAAPNDEDAAKPSPPAPRLPDLSAQSSETPATHNPVARFRSVKEGFNTLPEEEINSDVKESGILDQADTAAEQSADDNEELVAEAKAEPTPGPVITIPPPPTQTHAYENKIAAGPAADSSKEAAAGNKEEITYYHVSSVSFSQDAMQSSGSEAGRKKIAPYAAKRVTKELREILPPNIELASRMDQEEHEERILVAASSIKAGGWQNAPEPRQTAERGIVEIEVANGNGTKGSAGKVAEHLRRCGFKVVRVMDAQSHDHLSTKVFYYGGNLTEAQRLLKAIPEITHDAELYELQSMGSHVRLLIGKDLVERNKTLTWAKPHSFNVLSASTQPN